MTKYTAEQLLDMPKPVVRVLARRNGIDPAAFEGPFAATDLAVALAEKLNKGA